MDLLKQVLKLGSQDPQRSVSWRLEDHMKKKYMRINTSVKQTYLTKH